VSIGDIADEVGAVPRERPMSPARARRRRAKAALAVAAVAVAGLVMPPVYALAAFHGAVAPLGSHGVLVHLALNSLANLAVMLGALRTRGRLDQRLAQVLSLTLLAHGALAFLTLITRHYYSIPMMVVGVAASVCLGACAIWLRSRAIRLSVGVLGPWHPILNDPNIDSRRLEAGTAGLEDIDLVLVTYGEAHAVTSEPLLVKALLAGKRVRHVAEFVEEGRGACELDHFDIDQIPGHGQYAPAKRALDLAFVVVTAPASLPLLLLAAAGVLITMGRPVFFVQPRMGRGGKVFNMLKLRTMRPGPAESAGLATVPQDARITPFGRFLRRFRIDELPQLLNVLRGDMSVIGPRPEQAGLAARYTRETPKFALRLLVRPGITGWAQVRAGYAADLAETRIKLSYDLFYLKNVSLALDLQILARTFWTLAHGGGVR
jgi:lipopolysaccharide/colanic/teichoic acid biosynthesis glycosyltransferase